MNWGAPAFFAAGKRNRRQRPPVLLFSLVLTACQNMPEPYAPPEQRQTFENFRPYRVTRIVDMSDGDAPEHFVRDITNTGTGSWRWTMQRPTVRVVLRSNENLTYTIDFSIAEATFKDTGPVTVSFFVNDHPLDKIRYASSGQQHFEKKVPQDWVQPNQETTLAAEIDKVWVSKEDGTHLGFLLTRIGLKQE